MLFGEYAVLEGHRALAQCFDRRISCTVERGGDRLQLLAPGVFEPAIDLPAEVLASGACPDERLALLWPVLTRHLSGGARLVFDAGFPPTWGLGSSSASSLAAAAALAGPGVERFYEVRDAQRALQGAASGYDAATQLLGGAVAYRDGDPAELESIEAGAPLQWVVAWTGEKVSTGGLIRDVRGRHPEGAPIYQAIGELAEEGIRLLQAGDARGLGAALNAGHAQLESLGVVPDEPAAIVRALQSDPDVLGARMCGAGGGDCLLILAEDPELAAAAARQHGLEVLDIAPDASGLVLEDSK